MEKVGKIVAVTNFLHVQENKHEKKHVNQNELRTKCFFFFVYTHQAFLFMLHKDKRDCFAVIFILFEMRMREREKDAAKK